MPQSVPNFLPSVQNGITLFKFHLILDGLVNNIFNASDLALKSDTFILHCIPFVLHPTDPLQHNLAKLLDADGFAIGLPQLFNNPNAELQ